MIYTLTMNPAIDLFCLTNQLEAFTVNRSQKSEAQANGKGVNVSLVMNQLEVETTNLGFIAGFTGNYIVDELENKKIKTDFIEVEGTTRINVFINVEGNQSEYKLVNPGPIISVKVQEELLAKLKKMTSSDLLIVSGSLPQGIEPIIFEKIAQICHEQEVPFILDTSYREVLSLLSYQPLLLKPNDEELEHWFDVTLHNEKDFIHYAKLLIEMGAKSVLLSLGEKGALYLSDEGIWKGNAPSGKVVNTACAGDTLLATFVSEKIKGKTIEDALKRAIAAGSSTAFREGITDFSDVENLAKEITIIKLEG